MDPQKATNPIRPPELRELPHAPRTFQGAPAAAPAAAPSLLGTSASAARSAASPSDSWTLKAPDSATPSAAPSASASVADVHVNRHGSVLIAPSGATMLRGEVVDEAPPPRALLSLSPPPISPSVRIGEAASPLADAADVPDVHISRHGSITITPKQSAALGRDFADAAPPTPHSPAADSWTLRAAQEEAAAAPAAVAAAAQAPIGSPYSRDVASPSSKRVADTVAPSKHGVLLLFACKSGALDEAMALLDAGADVLAETNGRNALYWACRGGFSAMARALIERGADVQSVDTLWWACHHGESMRSTALALLAAGALPSGEAPAPSTTTPLWETCNTSGADAPAQAQLARALLNSGARGGNGELWCAARAGAKETITTILASGVVDVVADDVAAERAARSGPYSGTTTLWWCCYHGLGMLAVDVARRGVDPDPVARGGSNAFQGTSALWWAASRAGDPTLDDDGKSLDAAVRELVTSGAHLDRAAAPGSGDGGTTPLWWTAFRGKPHLAHLLLGSGCNPSAAVHRDTGSNSGTDALWWACYHGLSTLAFELMAYDDVDIDAICTGAAWLGRTPLSNACRHGEPMAQVAIALLRRGARTMSTDAAGLTPLGVARMARGMGARMGGEIDGEVGLVQLISELEQATSLAAFGPIVEAEEATRIAAAEARERAARDALDSAAQDRASELAPQKVQAGDALVGFLAAARLSEYASPLRAIGVTEVEHLLGVDEAAAQTATMKPLHFRRLERALREQLGAALEASVSGAIGPYLSMRGLTSIAEGLFETGVELASDLVDIGAADLASLNISRLQLNQLLYALPESFTPLGAGAFARMLADNERLAAAATAATPLSPAASTASPTSTASSAYAAAPAALMVGWNSLVPRVPAYVSALRRSDTPPTMDQHAFVRAVIGAAGSGPESKSDGLLLALLFVTLDTNGTGVLATVKLEAALVALSDEGSVAQYESDRLEAENDAKQQEFAAQRLQAIQRGRVQRQTAVAAAYPNVESAEEMRRLEAAAAVDIAREGRRLSISPMSKGRIAAVEAAAEEKTSAEIAEEENDAKQQEFAAMRLQSIQRGRKQRQSDSPEAQKVKEAAATVFAVMDQERKGELSVDAFAAIEKLLGVGSSIRSITREQFVGSIAKQFAICEDRSSFATELTEFVSAALLEVENETKQQEFAALRLQSIQRGRTAKRQVASKKEAVATPKTTAVLSAETAEAQSKAAPEKNAAPVAGTPAATPDVAEKNVEKNVKKTAGAATTSAATPEAAEKKKKKKKKKKLKKTAGATPEATPEVAEKKKKKVKKFKKAKATTTVTPSEPEGDVTSATKVKKVKKVKKNKKGAADEEPPASSTRRPERVKKAKKSIRRPGARKSLADEVNQELEAAEADPPPPAEPEVADAPAEEPASPAPAEVSTAAEPAPEPAPEPTPEPTPEPISEAVAASPPVADDGGAPGFAPIPVASGFLGKKKKKDNSFQKRWFVMAEGELRTYKKEGDAEACKPALSLVNDVRLLAL
jgi:hypothetical protein